MSSVSFIVTVYNEEKTIDTVYKNIIKLVKFFKIFNYEIIIVNDFSQDSSENKILSLKKKNKKIKYIKHHKNLGMGASFKNGVIHAKKDYILLVPGDNEHTFNGLKPLFVDFSLDKYDIIIPYVSNLSSRKISRILISKFYTFLINVIFFKKIPYFNGCCLYRSKILKKNVKYTSNSSMTLLSEMLLRSLNNTTNYKIVSYKLNEKNKYNKSEALKLSNIIIGLFFIFKYRFKLLINKK